jgi:putative salt-induced outer membrane protein
LLSCPAPPSGLCRRVRETVVVIAKACLRGMVAAILTLIPVHGARAELPQPVRAMIDAALATDNEAKVRTVVEIARTTNPDDAAELDTILQAFETKLAERRAAETAARDAKMRSAGMFENWSGKGELGAFRATGNSTNTGVSTGLTAERKGIDWRHKLTARADYQRANGVTTREQFLGSYEPNFNVSPRFYAYALAQYERDRFQGFLGRYAVSGGMGYQALKKDDIQLAIKAGPAYRVTEFVDGRSESRIAGLIGIDFDWSITDRLKLTQDTNAVAEAGSSAVAIIDSRNTSVNLITGLNAKINNSLSARFAYTVEYDSNPPPGAVGTDTLTRMTLIYDF